MLLKQSVTHSKWVLTAILSLTVLSNCVSASSNFDTDFLRLYQTFYCFFRLLNRKLNEDSKKQSFSHFKWILHMILSLTVLSTCVFGSSNEC